MATPVMIMGINAGLDMINQIHLYSIKKQFNKKGMILSLKKAIKQILNEHKTKG
jgi:hypothetical protein